jgi:hypothetical protein
LKREANFSSPLALKIISFTLPESVSSSKVLIDCEGLKYLFPALLKKGIKAKDEEGQRNLDGRHVIKPFDVFINLWRFFKNLSIF